MKHLIALLAVALALALLPTAASAHHYRHHYSHAHRWHRYYGGHDAYGATAPTSLFGEVVGSRPRGCPYEYCGCEASLYLFGRIVDSLNSAAAWLRFPHVAPAPGMAAVARSRHHVLVLRRHVSGSYWVVHDGNSGHHLTRDHVRNIAGFTVVDPHRYA